MASIGRLVRVPLVLGSVVLAACGGGGGGSGEGNQAPTADAGSVQSVFKNETVSLIGAGSTDADGDSLTYHWTQTAGPAVILSSAVSGSPTFVAPAVSGTLIFSLVVNDASEDSVPDSVAVNVQNRAPSALAGTNMSVGTASVVTLDGRPSSDADGDTLLLTWVQKSGPVVVLIDNGNGTVRFTTPSVVATLEFTLNVDDGEGIVSDDMVVVVQSAAGNRSPVADAGTGDMVPRRSTVYLSGYGFDPDFTPVTFSWQQTAGPPVTLDNPTAPHPSFVAPEVEADLQFTLTVSDGQLSSQPDSVQFQVRNFAPYVSNITLTPNAPRTLDNLSVDAIIFDPDQDPVTVTYRWTRNGSGIAGQTTAILPDSEHVKNDSITVRVEASDSFATGNAEANVVILDSPAVLSATPPSQIDQGETLAFQITVSDPDGDPTDSLVIDYGPAGMAVDNAGQVTWTADGPLFDRSTGFNWRVGMAGQATAALQGTVTVNDPGRQYPLRRTGMEIPIYNSGLVVADLDGDGDTEMLVGSSSAVYELAKQGSGYAQAWMYPFDPGASAAVGAVAAADLDGDDRQEIFFAAADIVVRLDGVSRRVAATHDSMGAAYCRDLDLADLTGDGDLELVCLAGNSDYFYGDAGSIIVFNANTLAVEWESPDLPVGRALALGSVDADPAIEIVTAAGLVYDGATLANQWAYGPGFGSLVDTGDLDGDGIEEIVGMGGWNAFRGFSAILRSPLWEQAGFDFDALLVANIDADPAAEVLIGDGQWGNVTAWNYVPATNTLSQSWQINSQDHGVTSIAVGDVDGDGSQEIVWGSGESSSGPDVFVVAGKSPGITIEWTSGNPQELDGQFRGARLAEVAPGNSLLMFQSPSTDNGYGGMRLIGLEPATGLIRMSSEVGTNWSGVGALDVADYDLDGTDELFAATADLYNNKFVAYNFSGNVTEWTSPYGAEGTAVTHADLTGDGAAELVAITRDGSVSVYDVFHQSLVWKGTAIEGGLDVVVADLDGDGTPEIVALGYNRVVTYRKNAGPVAYVEAASQPVSDGIDLLVADTNGDDAMEIYVLTGGYSSAATIQRFDAALSPLGRIDLDTAATSLYLEDLGKARTNLLLSLGQYGSFYSQPPHLAALDPESGAVVWQTPGIYGTVPINSLSYLDFDGDGEREIAFGTSNSMYLTR